MSFLVLILGLFVFFIGMKVSSLSAELAKVKSDILKLAKRDGGFVVSGTQPINPVPASTSGQVVSPIASAPTTSNTLSTQPDAESRFVAWIKENWLLKLGVLMVLIAFGWFISYAFVYGWIGPVGRVVLGFIVGSLCAVFGTLRMNKSEVQGTAFLVLGSALTIITSFAGHIAYNFFTPTVALVIPFIVSLFVATVGATYNKLKIGLYAVLIGFSAPVFTHIDQLDHNLLYIYLAVVTSSCIWLAFRKNWRIVNAVSLIAVFFYSLPAMDAYWSNDFISFVLFALCGLFFVVSVTAVAYSKTEVDKSDVFVAIVNSLFLFLLIFSQIQEELQSIACAISMILFAFGSLFVFLKTKKPTFFYIYSVIAVAFLVVATAIELEGPALVFALAIESASVSIVSYLITRSASVGLRMSVLMVAPLALSLPSFFASNWRNAVFHDDFFIIAIVGFLFFTIGFFFYLMLLNAKDVEEGDKSIYTTHIIAGAVYYLALVWLVLHAGIANASVATTLALIIYTILGIGTYFKGDFSNHSALKYFGASLIALVVARLMLVDVWNMPLAQRILVFVLIGILFMSTAFIIKKKHDVSLS